MPNHIRKNSCDIGVRAGNPRVLRTQKCAGFILINALVKLAVVEGYGQTAKALSRYLSHQSRGHRRVNATAQVSAHRHIRPQSDPRRVLEQVQEFFCEACYVPIAMSHFLQIRGHPVLLRPYLVVLYGQRMTGWNLENVLEYCLGRYSRPERKDLIHPPGVDFPGDLGTD